VAEPSAESARRPDIIIPDAGALICLAQAGALHLLHEMGRSVTLVDIVADEVTRDLARPGTQDLARWIEDGRRASGDTPVGLDQTELGHVIRLARLADPSCVMRNGAAAAVIGGSMQNRGVLTWSGWVPCSRNESGLIRRLAARCDHPTILHALHHNFQNGL